MKTFTLTLTLLFASVVLNAQDYTWAKAVSSGGTSVYTGMAVTASGDLLVAGGSADYGGGAPNGFVIHKRSKTDGASLFSKKYNGNNDSKCYKMIPAADGSFYYIGDFYGNISFGADTLFTSSKVNWNKKDLMVAKFSPEGNMIWAKSLGTKGGEEVNKNIIGAHLLNGELYLMLELQEDSIFYGNTFVTKLPQAMTFRNTYCAVKITGSNGDLAKFSRIDAFPEGLVWSYRVMQDGSSEITFESQSYLVKATINSGMTSYSRNDSVLWGGLSLFPEADVVKVEANGDDYYVLLVSNSGEALTVNGSDTIYPLYSQYNLRSAYLVKLNAGFKFIKATRLHWTYEYPTFRFSRGQMILRSKFLNVMYYNNGADSLKDNNNQHAWAVMALDTAFKVKDTFQVNTNSTNNTFAIRDAHFDEGGNLYSVVTHGKNITFGPVTVLSGNKSWDHLTVLCKRGSNGAPVGIAEQAAKNAVFSVYPNPASGIIMLNAGFDTKNSQISIYDLQGRLHLQMKASREGNDISALPAGAYFIKAEGPAYSATAKFIKL